MSSKEMSTEKQRSQRGARRHANNEAATKDNDVVEASLPADVAALATNITTEVAAIMEVKMSIFSSKLDIAAKLESESQRLEEAESRISKAEDTIANLDGFREQSCRSH